MKKIDRILSAIIALIFILYSVLPDVAMAQSINPRNSDKLAVALKCDDLIGLQRKDIGQIELALEAQLMTIADRRLPFDRRTFIAMQEAQAPDLRAIFNPPQMQFCLRTWERKGGGVCVKCKVMYGNDVMPRIYYALFESGRDAKGGFPIKVYTAKEYARFGDLLGLVAPERKAEDTPQPRDGKKRFAEKPGRSLDGALIVIEASPKIRAFIRENGYLTLEAYREGYAEVAPRFGFSALPEKIENDTTSRDDLQAVVEEGFFDYAEEAATSMAYVPFRIRPAGGYITNFSMVEERILRLVEMVTINDPSFNESGKKPLFEQALNKLNWLTGIKFVEKTVSPRVLLLAKEALKIANKGRTLKIEKIAVAGVNLPVVIEEIINPDRVRPQEVLVPRGEDIAEARRAADAALERGAVAVITVAGGMSSRAGIEYPKGMHPITPLSAKTLFEQRAEEIKAFGRHYGAPVLWYLMTSDVTDRPTRDYFASNGYFGLGKENVIFIRQGSVPALESGTRNPAMRDASAVFTAPNGHGGLYEAMQRVDARTDGETMSGIETAARRGVDVFMLTNVDNPMPVIDRTVLGSHIVRESDFTSVVLRKRDPAEGLAMPVEDAYSDDRFFVEYNQPVAKILRERPGYEYGSINRLVFSRQFLATAGLPPYRLAAGKEAVIFKNGTQQKALIDKLESFVFELQDKARRALNIAGHRDECFAAFKKMDGPDSPVTVAKALSDLDKKRLAASGRAAQVSAESTLELSGAFALSSEDMADKIGSGFKVLGEASVYLGGRDIFIGNGVVIDGAGLYIEFEDPYDGSIEIADGFVAKPGEKIRITIKKGQSVKLPSPAGATETKYVSKPQPPHMSKRAQETERKAKEISRAVDYIRRLLPDGARLTDEEILEHMVSNNLDDHRRLDYRRGRERHPLPPTLIFRGDIFSAYDSSDKPRYIVLTSMDEGVAITSVFSDTKTRENVLSKGGARWWRVGKSKVESMDEKFKGNPAKNLDPLLPEGVRLAEAMFNKNPFWEVYFDGGKTVLLASADADKETFVRDWVASSILAGALMKLYIAGPDTEMGSDEMGWIEDEKDKSYAEFGLSPTSILATTSRDSKAIGTFPHEEWTVTSIGVVETMLTALSDQRVRSRYGLDAIESGKVSVGIMGFGDVGAGVLWYLQEFHKDAFDKLMIQLIGNKTGSIYCKNGLDKDKLIRIVAGIREGKIDRDFDIREMFKEEIAAGTYAYVENPRDAYFCGAEVLIPAARGVFITNRADIAEMKAKGTRLYVEGANNSIGSGLEAVFEDLGVCLFDGPIANGGGIYSSKEECLHAILEGERSMFANREERRHHIQGDIADIAIANTGWLIDQLIAGHGASIFEIHRRITREIRAEKARLLDSPTAGDRAEIGIRVEKDLARSIVKDQGDSAEKDNIRRFLAIVNATEIARERVMGRYITRDAVLIGLGAGDIRAQKAAAYWAGKLRIKGTADALYTVLSRRQADPSLRRLAAISLAYIHDMSFVKKLEKILGDSLPEDVKGGVEWALKYMAPPMMEAVELGADQAPAPAVLAALGAMRAIEEEVAAMRTAASAAGILIPTHPAKRYTLLMAEEFFGSGELEEQRGLYGDFFNLDRVSGTSQEQFIGNILAKASGVETRTIALVPDDIADIQLQRLAKAGVRFIRTKTGILRDAKRERDVYRKKFQLDTYVTMVLARRIDDQTPEDSPIYRMLAFYLKSHFALDGGNGPQAIKDYIDAIRKNDITGLLKGILSYRPIQAYNAAKDYESIAKVLIAA